MSTINDGGAAFPIPSYLDKPTENGERLIIIESNGMSLRDYFSAKAMQGLITSENIKNFLSGELPQNISKMAYFMADAMLAERQKGQSE